MVELSGEATETEGLVLFIFEFTIECKSYKAEL